MPDSRQQALDYALKHKSQFLDELITFAAIGRALGWVTRHPASVQDGGIEDMIDEGLSFFVLHNIASSQTDRAQFLEMMRMRLSAVARQPELEHWVRHPGPSPSARPTRRLNAA